MVDVFCTLVFIDVHTDRICRRPMIPTTSLNCYDRDIIGGTLPRSPQSRASCCETLRNGNVYHYSTVAEQMPQRPLSMIGISFKISYKMNYDNVLIIRMPLR